jgi:hypothetical protein
MPGINQPIPVMINLALLKGVVVVVVGVTALTSLAIKMAMEVLPMEVIPMLAYSKPVGHHGKAATGDLVRLLSTRTIPAVMNSLKVPNNVCSRDNRSQADRLTISTTPTTKLAIETMGHTVTVNSQLKRRRRRTFRQPSRRLSS